MVRISVSIKSNRLGELAARAPNLAAGAVREAVQAVVTEAQSRVPVDTGALKSSIRGRVLNQQSGEVTAGGGEVDYATYVEEGTVKSPAQPFMHPAADVVRPQFEAAVAKALAGLG